jgi:hypothetical protein
MSFWGGFVEGFATTAKEEIDLDVAKTDKIVNDTVKIGVQKALDTQEEIKKDKRRIKGELEMLTSQGFSLPKAASIVKAGMTTSIIKLKNDSDYKGKADGLWDGTTKFAQDNKLTIQDVVNKLSYQPPLDYGNLKVGSTQNSLLAAIGLSPNIDSRIQSGIKTRVGTLDTGVDRSDINILPGSIPLTAKAQFDTEKTMTTDQKLLELLIKRNTKDGILNEQGLTNDILISKNPNLVKQLGLGELITKSTLGAKPDVDPKFLQDLYTKSQGQSKEAINAKEQLKNEIERIKKKYGKDYSNNLVLGFK